MALVVKNPPVKARDRLKLDPWIGKIPLRRKWQPIPAFLPKKFQGQRNLAGYSPWDHKELNMIEHACMHVLF